jgi:hypothetical protein
MVEEIEGFEDLAPDVRRKQLEEDTSRFRHNRHSLLFEIAEEYQKNGDEEEAKGVRAEAAALMLCERGDSFPGYYQPMMTFTNGATSPPLSFFSSEVLEYLGDRGRTIHNPILASRFTDVVWDLSQTKDPQMARIAIDNYFKCISIYKSNSWGVELSIAIKRAVQLASMINDVGRLSHAKENIFRLMRELDDQKDYRFCIDLASSIAMSNKIKLSEMEAQEVKNVLSRATAYYQGEHPVDESRLGPVEGPNEHFVRSFHEAIINLASTGHLVDIDKNLHRIEIARSHEREGDKAAANKDNLVAIVCYRSADKCFSDLGLTKERDRLRVKLTEAGLKAEEELMPIQAEVKIEVAKIEEYIKPLIADNIAETLQIIASAPHFIPSIKETSRLADEMKQKYPIQYLVSHTVLHEGHIVSSPSTEDEVLSQSIIRHLVMDIHTGGIFLTHLFNKLIKEQGLDAEILTKHFEKWGICEQRNLLLLKKGFGEYFDSDYIAALHILIPQFEDILRNLLRKAHQPISRPGYGVLTLGSLLSNETFINTAGEDLIRYYEVALKETTGLNLRDDLTHGLMNTDLMTQNITSVVIHLLLTLTRFSIKPKD